MNEKQNKKENKDYKDSQTKTFNKKSFNLCSFRSLLEF